MFGYYADISPAGDKVAYTSCEFPQNVAAGGKYPAVSSEVGPPSANYDIVVGELGKDGRHGIINNTRITNTSRRLDHYPVWSPDGTWIASLSMDRTPTPYELSPKFVLAQYLEVRRADGSSKVPTVLVSTLERFDDRAPSIALIPPVWSPDGRYIAYYLVVKKDSEYTYELSGVANLPNLSKSGRHRIGTTTSALETIPPRPSWSDCLCSRRRNQPGTLHRPGGRDRAAASGKRSRDPRDCLVTGRLRDSLRCYRRSVFYQS